MINTLTTDETRKYVRPFTTPVPTREISLVYHHSQWKTDLISALSQSIFENLPESLQKKVTTKKNHVLDVE
jgi:hypothetical protein